MRRSLTALLLLLACPLLSSSPADAAPDIRSGWWNTATVTGVPLPATTAPDNLHLAAEPTGSLAFAAVSFHTTRYDEAVLTLHVTPGTEIGTPAVMACPTRNDSWKAGGDQPRDTAPPYDCAGRAVTGVIRSDTSGTTLTFLLDPSAQLSLGTTSLALVPIVSSTSPFSLDLIGPDSRALQPTSAPTPPPAPAPASVTPTQPSLSSAPTRTAAPGLQPASVPALQTPALSFAGAPAPSVAAVPRMLTPPPAAASGALSLVPRDQSRRDAVVLLALVIGALGYVLTQHQNTPPRLLGSRARALVPELAAAGQEGGIGRFTRPRTQPARRLL